MYEIIVLFFCLLYLKLRTYIWHLLRITKFQMHCKQAYKSKKYIVKKCLGVLKPPGKPPGSATSSVLDFFVKSSSLEKYY